MNLKTVISLLMLVLAFGVLSQDSEEIDSTRFETHCECLKTAYLFKKEFIESFTSVEDSVVLRQAFIEKHDFNWEKLTSIQTRCDQLSYSGIEPKTCPYEQNIRELTPDFELVLRVLKMNGEPHGNY